MIKKIKKTKREIKADRIKEEEQKLEEIFQTLENDKKTIADGLIKRAAFMRIELEDLEANLNIHHWSEKFQQGDQKPYMRARPEGQTYISLNKNYQGIMKQLIDLIPEQTDAAAATEMLKFVGRLKK